MFAALGATAALLVSGLTPMPADAVPQTSACATESCDGFDFSNRCLKACDEIGGNKHEALTS